MKIIRIDALETILQTWENKNMLAELNFAFYLAFQGWAQEWLLEKPLIGSEISENGDLARPIPDYKLLRKNLEKRENLNDSNFLPRIPKDLRDIMTETSWLWKSDHSPVNLVPFFLQNWVISKKSCFINKSQIIPLINPAEKNYLQYLPYSCFFLQLEEAINFDFDGTKFDAKNFIFCKLGDNYSLEILIFPDTDNKRMSPEKRNEFLNIIKEVQACGSLNKRKKLNHNQAIYKKVLDLVTTTNQEIIGCGFINTSIHLDSGGLLFEDSKCERIAVTMEGCTEESNDPFIKTAFFANGLCKLFSELEPTEVNQLTPINPEEKTDNPPPEPSMPVASENLQWNELFQGQIKKVTLEKKDGIARIKTVTGGEKSPHLRRTHNRHFFDKDGKLLKTIIVREAIIRKDKLSGACLRGSSLELKY